MVWWFESIVLKAGVATVNVKLPTYVMFVTITGAQRWRSQQLLQWYNDGHLYHMNSLTKYNYA